MEIICIDVHPARRIRLEHQGLANEFNAWDERTQDATNLHWGASILESRGYFGVLVLKIILNWTRMLDVVSLFISCIKIL